MIKKKPKPLSGKACRAKGLAFERWVAQQIRHIFPGAKRLLENQEGYGYDIEDAGCLRIQCKRNRKYASISKIKEAGNSGIPMLVTKGDNEVPMIALRFEDFIAILDNPEIMKDLNYGQSGRSTKRKEIGITRCSSGDTETN